MKPKTFLTRRAADLIRWQFRFRNRVVTCGITRLANNGFGVVTLPHWDIKSGVVETFNDAASAAQRHAMIVDRLRSTGWSLASYTT